MAPFDGQTSLSLIENMSYVVISVDKDGIINCWNKAAELTLGFEASEALGQRANLVIPVNMQQAPGLESGVDLQHFQQCVAHADNLKAALKYYRASLGSGPRTDAYNTIQNKGLEPLSQPVLYLHGRNDGCIGAELTEEARAQDVSAVMAAARLA